MSRENYSMARRLHFSRERGQTVVILARGPALFPREVVPASAGAKENT
jgi:hypothetical protein